MKNLPKVAVDSRIVFLMGATACGKTALSLQLARQLDAEIVSVDSVLVYRGMNIGTAKPAIEERAGIAHHLIDICDPWDIYSAARFVEDAHLCIDRILGKGKVALLTGGTMLYYRAIEQGLASLPEADPALRRELTEEAARVGWPTLHAELNRVDPVSAARIHPNDPQRLQRALEVYRSTGRALSELQASTETRLLQSPFKIALVPADRAWLHTRISERFQMMLDAGFLAEVDSLLQEPRIHAGLPAMRSVGYRQALQLFSGELTRDDWIEKAIIATRQLAKRQLTWIRHMEDIHVLHCDRLSLACQVDKVLSLNRTVTGNDR